jgi:two-component system phosphate regulon response regulator PhoB
MLWDKSGVEPVRLVSEKRGVAFALTTCQSLVERLIVALDLACIDVISFQKADKCAAAIASEKPDIVLLDERVEMNTIDLQAKLSDARVTETLPILPIRSGSFEDTLSFSLSTHSDTVEIFLKVRALLRRERPAALRGRRQHGSLTLDEPRFKLFVAEESADLSKTDLCLLGPFFDVQNGKLDRLSLEQLVFDASDRRVGSRIVDSQICRLRRGLKTRLSIDPIRSVRGVGYALAQV